MRNLMMLCMQPCITETMIPNEGVIKATIDYTCYKANAEKAVPKFKYYKMCMDELKEVLDTEIKPLINPL